MKIGITGGTGFIGRYILDQLSGNNQLKCWYRSENSPFRTDVEWIQGDLNHESSMAKLVQDCDAVVHNGLWRTSESFRGEESSLAAYLETNLIGTIRLIEAAQKANVKKFVFVSTCAVHEKILDDRPLDESHPAWPLTHYGAHKAAIERFVHSYGWGNGFDICAIRPTGVYGLHHQASKSKWFDLVQDIVNERPVEVSGGGKEVHAADVAKAIDVLIHSNGTAGEVFNCYDRYISRFEVASLAKSICGSSSEIRGEPRSPKNQIETGKIRALGMEFSGDPLLAQTVQQLVSACNK